MESKPAPYGHCKISDVWHDPPDALLTEKKLAQRWSVSPKALQKARYSGCGITVPYIKLSNLVRYRLEDVIQYENTNFIKIAQE